MFFTFPHIQTPPVPAYDSVNEEDLSDESYCAPDDEFGYYGAACYKVFTRATDAQELASITEDVSEPNIEAESPVIRTDFYHGSYDSSTYFATSYCFRSSEVADRAFEGFLSKLTALMIGKTDSCYLYIFRNSRDPRPDNSG